MTGTQGTMEMKEMMEIKLDRVLVPQSLLGVLEILD